MTDEPKTSEQPMPKMIPFPAWEPGPEDEYPEGGYPTETSEQPSGHLRSEIAVELYLAFEKHGADSELLSIVGSYGDTQPDEWVLRELRKFNERHGE